MIPITLADAELQMRAAIDAGDDSRIDAAAALVDRLAERRPIASLHAAALWYASQGLHVFPLTPGTKIPLKGSGGCKDATTDAAMIDRWWTGNHDLNIGIATGHLVDVIDVDGPDGVRSWAHYADDLPPILGRVSTPRPGGNHLYVTAVPGRGNKAGLLPKVDYRGTGGYVVAPPSVIISGPNPGRYEWHAPLDVAAVLEVAA